VIYLRQSCDGPVMVEDIKTKGESEMSDKPKTLFHKRPDIITLGLPPAEEIEELSNPPRCLQCGCRSVPWRRNGPPGHDRECERCQITFMTIKVEGVR
jgi:hypothetical protein